MKAKISVWGNSHGIRMSAPILDHLNVKPGVELNIKLTDKGIEIMKNTPSQEYVATVAQETIDDLMANSDPVRVVSDPYDESDIGYLVITINPCKPVLREVSLDTPDCYKTLTDAKEAARQVIQNAIADGKESLSELRQIGIENITYIAL